jgi:MarR family transcriptional regulator for hemolysin
VGANDKLGRVLALALKGLQGEIDARMAATGSSLSTYLVLRQVDSHPRLSQRELAARMGIEGPTLTHHLDRLGERGLVERVRSDADRRVWTTVLTEAGRRELERTAAVAEEANAELLALFSESELATLTDCLQRLIDRYGRHALDHHGSAPVHVRTASRGR